MLDGRTGQEIWSVDKPDPNSTGFSGISIALGDVDGDALMDIVAVTGEGFVVMLDSKGTVVRTSDKPIPGNADAAFGWGGGLAIADIDHDGFPGDRLWRHVCSRRRAAPSPASGAAPRAWAAAASTALSTFVGSRRRARRQPGAARRPHRLQGRRDRPLGPPDLTRRLPGDRRLRQRRQARGVLVGQARCGSSTALSGATVLGPLTLPGNGAGGPPTVADFDGDGKAEIGVAQQNLYSMLKPNYGTMRDRRRLAGAEPRSLQLAVTGSSVFDFEGDGKAEVIYADECFLWVFDGRRARSASPPRHSPSPPPRPRSSPTSTATATPRS
jgi:hypothetical protein